MDNLEIIDYEPVYQPYFKSLNAAWIEKYFVLENFDNEVLDYPEEYIYKDGGIIILAKYQDTIAGTVALKRVDDSTFEMIKMAVDEQLQGYHIGYHLGKAIIEKAINLGAEKIILYSRTSLLPAIQLYKKLGFKEVTLEPGKYARCDIKMEIVFKEQAYLSYLSGQLKDTIDKALEKFKTIDEATWKAKTDFKKWSKKEILGHLIDSAANNHQRFVRAQYHEKLASPIYKQDKWVDLQNYQNSATAELQELWYAYNRHLCAVIHHIRYDKIQTVCIIGENEPVTLAFLVEDYISHLQHHLKQIFE
jgi:GNAT superfamily N-acetyltransferase